jgi:hypothetical protein
MSQHLKNSVMNGLRANGCIFMPLPPQITPHSKGVRYLTLNPLFTTIRGAMDPQKIGQKRRKRIVVRPSRHHLGLHELYTYHFPKHWSEACVSNRELIKEAQRQAHALEHDCSFEAVEWRIRFFSHYFRVVKGGEEPAPGMKPYSRFYQFVYVSIYRFLQAAQQQTCQATQQPATETAQQADSLFPAPRESAESRLADEVSFVPIRLRSSTTFAHKLRKIHEKTDLFSCRIVDFLPDDGANGADLHGDL